MNEGEGREDIHAPAPSKALGGGGESQASSGHARAAFILKGDPDLYPTAAAMQPFLPAPPATPAPPQSLTLVCEPKCTAMSLS